MKRLNTKYIVSKADGSPVDPMAQYLVLRLDEDSSARMAAREYADLCDHAEFGKELHNWLDAFADNKSNDEEDKAK